MVRVSVSTKLMNDKCTPGCGEVQGWQTGYCLHNMIMLQRNTENTMTGRGGEGGKGREEPHRSQHIQKDNVHNFFYIGQKGENQKS